MMRCFAYIVRQIRRPVVAYLLVMTIVGSAFALFQINVNDRLQMQDYKACVSRNEILTQANERNARLVTRDGKPVDVYKLSNCDPLKP